MLQTRSKRVPKILKEIDLEMLIAHLIEKANNSMEKQYPRAPISYEDYQFAKEIIENHYLPELRPDNFCIDLAQVKLEDWTKGQYRAFAKLYAMFSDEAARHLKDKQDKKNNIAEDAQLLWLKLPKQNDKNKKIVNGINKILLNHDYEQNTGNENAITLLKYINSQKKNPITPYSKINYSISLVIVTEKDQVLLLKRAGLSGRAGTWGTLTGKIEAEDGCKEKTLVREVHEEINLLLEGKYVHYVGSLHTSNLSKDLVEKGKSVSYSDDHNYVYGIIIPEEELIHSIKLDSENSSWKLFSRKELYEQFKVHNPEIHGNNVDPTELHVALAKSLLVLDCSRNHFENVEQRKFNYPYTNSPGFFVHFKNHLIEEKELSTHEMDLRPN